MWKRPKVPEVTVEQAIELQKIGARLIDVRESSELAQARVGGAEHAPMSSAVQHVLTQYPHTETTLVILCHSGARSAAVVHALQAQGYTNVHNLTGGILAWIHAKQPVLTQ